MRLSSLHHKAEKEVWEKLAKIPENKLLKDTLDVSNLQICKMFRNTRPWIQMEYINYELEAKR